MFIVAEGCLLDFLSESCCQTSGSFQNLTRSIAALSVSLYLSQQRKMPVSLLENIPLDWSPKHGNQRVSVGEGRYQERDRRHLDTKEDMAIPQEDASVLKPRPAEVAAKPSSEEFPLRKKGLICRSCFCVAVTQDSAGRGGNAWPCDLLCSLCRSVVIVFYCNNSTTVCGLCAVTFLRNLSKEFICM